MIERYGSGMRVRKICKEYGVKEPDFNEIFDGFQVILHNEKNVEIEDNSDNAMIIGRETEIGEKMSEEILNIVRDNSKVIIDELSAL